MHARLSAGRLAALLAVLCAALVSGCDRVRAGVGAELPLPFALARLWELGPGPDEGLEACFVALDGAGAPLSHALIELTWDEGGRMAFQADEKGELWMRFPARAELGGATVRLQVVPVGQSFVGHEYADYARAPVGGKLRVEVRACSESP